MPIGCLVQLADRDRAALWRTRLPKRLLTVGDDSMGSGFIRKTWASVLGTILMYCSPACIAATVDPLANVHSVSIVSAMGKDIYINNLGTTIFSNSSAPLALDWDVDSQVMERIGDVAKDRFSIVPVPGNAANLATILENSRSAEADIKKYIQSLASAGPADAYIVVVPMHKTIPFMGKGMFVRGLGYTRIENMFTSNVESLASATYEIRIMDAKSGAILERSSGEFPSDGWFSPATIMAFCDSSLRVQTPQDATDSQKASIRDELDYLMLASLPYTMSRMGVTPAAGISQEIVQPSPLCTKDGNYISRG
jgi:hypothetical protein